MSIVDNVLREPSYGWKNSDGEFYRPEKKELIREFLTRLNFFKSKKNWLAAFCWGSLLLLFPFTLIFFIYHFSFLLLMLGFVYGMVIMGTHGTIWYHRYSTHEAYSFRNKFWKYMTSNLVPKMIPEEIYVISHHVHHAKSDSAGDPYNARGGWWYCFLADTNHQPIALNLSEAEYNKARFFLKHTGVYCNNYNQYKKWGSVSNPWYTIITTLLNMTFWYFAFYLLGGNALACALLGGAFFWALGVRTFNYKGHGKGSVQHKEGLDFNKRDLSVNQYWPGIVAGEWHNNHHLFPRSARSGFLKYQIDFAWYYIYFLYKIGAVKSYFNSRDKFISDYYQPKRRK